MKEDKSLRILVVDDHEMFREQACALLRSQPGFEVICEAANGLEGVSRAAELQPDVVVLDISMPSLGGIEAAGRIHRVAPKSQIVFLSQHNSETIAQTALAAGALAYVTKSRRHKQTLPRLPCDVRRLSVFTTPSKEVGYDFVCLEWKTS